MPAFAAARHVVAYAAVENEVDPAAIVAVALDAGKTVYYPRRAGDGLDFLAASPERLQPGPGGIAEPVAGDRLPVGDDGVLFLVPGVAFDARGARLGRGAGCYDRALARHRTATPVGLAYEMQLVPVLPEAAWDVRMAAVVTETRVLTPKEIRT
jgi:5-formyltetrahydrofolate cyclo-ligase